MKIIDKMKEAMKDKHTFYSFEFFPPKTESGVENLHLRMERMASLEPLFVDVTWGAGGSTADLTQAISAKAQKYLGVEVLMHLTCTDLTIDELKTALRQAREAGVQNILALRGDPAKGDASWEPAKGGVSYAADLVRLAREEHGDYFGIAVAGHPEGHADRTSREEELKYLKEKVDAGADFIITQFFYDTSAYTDYVKACLEVGIKCPIIPGIMPIQNHTALVRMTSFAKTRVPPEVMEALEPVKHDDEAVKQFGVELAMNMCKTLVAAGAPGLHFYTLNLERSVRLILEGGEVNGETFPCYTECAASRRLYPWRASALASREKEDVRPIHWANRPHSYISRTEIWDEFPNGRWGDGRSPAFGELSDSHFYRFSGGTKADRKAMWGEAPQDAQEIYEVFAKYVEGRIPMLPWCENQLLSETMVMRDELADINRRGYLTINSQPKVNGARSDDPSFGWGGAGGRVYQKAYLEFFCSPQKLQELIDSMNTDMDGSSSSSSSSLAYFAIDASGTIKSKGASGTCALTWGVFPEKEVQQPTIFDADTFAVWKTEAFDLWRRLWANLYDEESKSSAVLHEIHDTFFLVAIIDNDFVDGDLWQLFRKVV